MSSIQFSFYASPSVSSLTHDEDLVSVDHIFALCAHTTVYDKKTSIVGGLEPPTGMQEILVYPWEEIVEICAEQEIFTRLQLVFDKHEYLVQFMEAQRATLARLDGRVHLYYWTEDFNIYAADFETLNQLPGGTPLMLFNRVYIHIMTLLCQPPQMLMMNMGTLKTLIEIGFCRLIRQRPVERLAVASSSYY